MASVSVRNLSIRFGPHTVLQDLDLDVAEGEFLVLLGPSGCGKSTLLHSIAGLIDVSGGTVCIGGTDMTAAEPDKRGHGERRQRQPPSEISSWPCPSFPPAYLELVAEPDRAEWNQQQTNRSNQL